MNKQVGRKHYSVVVDCGNYTTKANYYDSDFTKGEGGVTIFTLASNGRDRINQNAYIVKYKGEDYVVGDVNKTANVNIHTSKMDLTHKLATLVAIHSLVPNGAEVELFVGMPIQSFYNVEHRNEYVNYYLQEGEVELVVNNVKKTFTIAKVVALPESVGYVFNYPSDSLIGVVDIGYTTVDASVFHECSPIKDTVFSLVEGANSFVTQARDSLLKELLVNYPEWQMNEILTKGVIGDKAQKVKEVVYNCKIDYLRKLANQMVKHGWEIDSLPIIFTGGGSILLAEVINDFETFTLSENPIYDNLDGFVEMGMILNE